MLVMLPIEVLNEIVLKLKTFSLHRLWFCGDRRLNHALGSRGGITEIHLHDASRSSTSRLPQILRFLPKLVQLHLSVEERLLAEPAVLWNIISNLKQLRYIFLRCSNPESWLFPYACEETSLAHLMEPDSTISQFTPDYFRMRSLEKHLPYLEEMYLAGQPTLIQNDDVTLFPRRLTGLGLTFCSNLSAEGMAHLPPNLTRLDLPFFMPDMDQAMAFIPTSVSTLLALNSSDFHFSEMVLPPQVTEFKCSFSDAMPKKLPSRLRKLDLSLLTHMTDMSSLLRVPSSTQGQHGSSGYNGDGSPLLHLQKLVLAASEFGSYGEGLFSSLPVNLTSLIVTTSWRWRVEPQEAECLLHLKKLHLKQVYLGSVFRNQTRQQIFGALAIPISVTDLYLCIADYAGVTNLGPLSPGLTRLNILASVSAGLGDTDYIIWERQKDVQWPPGLREVKVAQEFFSFERAAFLSLPRSITNFSLGLSLEFLSEEDLSTMVDGMSNPELLQRISLWHPSFISSTAHLKALPTKSMTSLKLSNVENYPILSRFTHLTKLKLRAQGITDFNVSLLPRSITKLALKKSDRLTPACFCFLPRLLRSLKMRITVKNSATFNSKFAADLPRTITRLVFWELNEIPPHVVDSLPTAIRSLTPQSSHYEAIGRKLRNEPLLPIDPRTSTNSVFGSNNFY